MIHFDSLQEHELIIYLYNNIEHIEMDNGCLSWLSQLEKQKYNRLHHSDDKKSYLMQRYIVRDLISSINGCAPEAVQFHYDNHKPKVLTRYFSDFNMSHHGQMFAIAFSVQGCCGIDIEQMRPIANVHKIAHRFFNTEEKKILFAEDVDIMHRFLCCWTRKEAVVKMHAQGMFASAKKYDISQKSVRFSGKRLKVYCDNFFWEDAVIAVACSDAIRYVRLVHSDFATKSHGVKKVRFPFN